MSTEITRFNHDVKASAAMQEEIKAFGGDLDKAVAYANTKGYKFTASDVMESAASKQELSDEALDKVAGGGFIYSTGLNRICGW